MKFSTSPSVIYALASRVIFSLTFSLIFTLFPLFSKAQTRVDKLTQDRALRVIERLVGSKVDTRNPDVQAALSALQAASTREAQLEALRRVLNLESYFRVTVRNFAARMSVRGEEVSTPMNDFIATVIGMARDERDAREMLTGNYIYWADPERVPTGITIRSNLIYDVLRSRNNNTGNPNHYVDIESNLYRISLSQVLSPLTQQLFASVRGGAQPVVNPSPAGLLTSFTWAREHLIAGTNRRAYEYTLRSFLCTPIERAADPGASDSRIRRDVDRFPGGDHQKFLTSCKGCHTVMDGGTGAFARWNFIGGMVIFGGFIRGNANMDGQGIANKMNRDVGIFPSGAVVTDDSWVNYANRGARQEYFGWRGAMSGQGLTSFGKMISESERFPKCLAQRAYQEVCQRSADRLAEFVTPEVDRLAKSFVDSGYRLNSLFAEAALSCQ